jgi:hypothetical protein
MRQYSPLSHNYLRQICEITWKTNRPSTERSDGMKRRNEVTLLYI